MKERRGVKKNGRARVSFYSFCFSLCPLTAAAKTNKEEVLGENDALLLRLLRCASHARLGECPSSASCERTRRFEHRSSLKIAHALLTAAAFFLLCNERSLSTSFSFFLSHTQKHTQTVVRHQHNTGFKHRANVRNYYAQFLLAQAIPPGPVPGPGGGPAPQAYTASGPPRPGGGGGFGGFAGTWRPPVRGPPGVSVYYPRGPPPQGAGGGGGFAPGYQQQQQQGFRPPFAGGPPAPPPQQQQQGYFPPPPPLQ